MKRVVILGANDNLIIYLAKYFALNGIETYVIVRKGEDYNRLDELGKHITIVRYDGNIDHLKLFFTSVEPDIVYNLDNVYKEEYTNDSKVIIERNYKYVTEILESLTEHKKTVFVNFVSKSDDGIIIKDLYSAILNSTNSIFKYYREKHGVNIVLKEKIGDIKLDMNNLLDII